MLIDRKLTAKGMEVSIQKKDDILVVYKNTADIKDDDYKPSAYSASDWGKKIAGTKCEFIKTTNCRGICYHGGEHFTIGEEFAYQGFSDHDLGHHAADKDRVASYRSKGTSNGVPALVNDKGELVAKGRKEILNYLQQKYQTFVKGANSEDKKAILESKRACH
jgi:hypothetical protein